MNIKLKKGFIFKPHNNNILVIDHKRNNLIINYDLFDLYPIEIITIIEKRFLIHYNLILLHTRDINKIKSNNFKKYMDQLNKNQEDEHKFLNQILAPLNIPYLWHEFNYNIKPGQNTYKNIVFELRKHELKILSSWSITYSKIFNKDNILYQEGGTLKKYLKQNLWEHEKKFMKTHEIQIKEV